MAPERIEAMIGFFNRLENILDFEDCIVFAGTDNRRPSERSIVGKNGSRKKWIVRCIELPSPVHEVTRY